MSKIRVLVVPPDIHGVGKFRMVNPYSYIQENYGEDFHIDLKLNVPDEDNEFDDYDVIIIHTFIHNTKPFERNIERVNWLKNKGKIVIVDNDDFWEPDFRHPMYHQIVKSGTAKRKVELLKSASYVSVTTPIFRDTIIKKLGIKNVQVFPNAVDENEPQFKPLPIESDKTRFGWLGGSSHLHDIEILRSGINSTFNSSKDNVQFVLCGFDLRGSVTEINRATNEERKRDIKPQETVWYLYEKIFTDNYNVLDKDYADFLMTFKETNYDDVDKPYRRRWTKDITKYATNYNYFDISLAPLVESVFNGNKSQLKAIEAGFHKKALIASEVNPYTLDLISAIDKGGSVNNKGNSLLVSSNKNHKQWGQHMKRLIDNPNMIEDLGNKLYETVKDTYSLKKVSNDRVQFIKSIINK